MKDHTLLGVGVTGAVVAAMCGATPILVVLFRARAFGMGSKS